MNPENQNPIEPGRQLANLKQVIIRSEAAIAALKKLISVADGKIKALEAQTEGKCLPERVIPSPNIENKSLSGLRMFR